MMKVSTVNDTPPQLTEQSFAKRYGLFFALAALVAIIAMPNQEGLPIAGQRMLGVLVFSIIVWMTEAVSYPVSAAVITALMAFLLGLSPNVNAPAKILGTAPAMGIALSGFATSSLAMITGALCLAVGMQKTGLVNRIALIILAKTGPKPNRIVFGIIFVGFVLSFFVPSTTARVACLIPIIMGVIAAFGVDMKSKFAGVMMIAAAQADSIWNVGIKTAALQNGVAIGFIEKMLGKTISWLDWFIAAAPFAAIMSVVLYFTLLKIMPPEKLEFTGGQEALSQALKDLGPMKIGEKKMLVMAVTLLFFWSTEQVLHPLDTSATTIAVVALMLLPGIGVISWKEAQLGVNWGTVILFGVGISLGTAILATKAAPWLGKMFAVAFNMTGWEPIGIVAMLAAFLIIIHLGFASATALASAMIPIIIAVLQGLNTPGINVLGLTLILQFVVSFGFILPVNAPQNMVAYCTETFEVKDFIKTGIPLTIFAYLTILLLTATYWKWLGLA